MALDEAPSLEQQHRHLREDSAWRTPERDSSPSPGSYLDSPLPDVAAALFASADTFAAQMETPSASSYHSLHGNYSEKAHERTDRWTDHSDRLQPVATRVHRGDQIDRLQRELDRHRDHNAVHSAWPNIEAAELYRVLLS